MAIRGDVDGLRNELKEDPDLIYKRSSFNSLLLHFAVEHNQLEIARLLIAAGADTQSEGHNSLLPIDFTNETRMKKLLEPLNSGPISFLEIRFYIIST